MRRIIKQMYNVGNDFNFKLLMSLFNLMMIGYDIWTKLVGKESLHSYCKTITNK